jgi:WD40 repeat protein
LPKLSKNIVTSQTFNGDNYYLDNFGNLYKNGEKLTEKPFPVKAETEYKLRVFPEKIFLSEDKTLYLFNPDSKIFEKFFEGINNLKISPDGKKLAYFSDSEIWVLFLKEKLTPPLKKAGEKILLVRFSEKIENAFWLNSDYLIFNAGDKIKITEIDERDKLNIVDLIEFKKPKIFFNQTDKKLYVLSEEKLFQSSPLLP